MLGKVSDVVGWDRGQVFLGGSVLIRHLACERAAQKMSQLGRQGAQNHFSIRPTLVTALLHLGV